MALKVTNAECEKTDQELIDIEKYVEDFRQSAAKHEESMKRSVINSTNTYLKMSQTAIRMSDVGYCSDVRAELFELVFPGLR